MDEKQQATFELARKIDSLIKDQCVFLHTERVMGKTIAEKRRYEFLSALLDIVSPKTCSGECACGHKD